MCKTRITDLDDLKHRIRTEWANLDHALQLCVNGAVVIPHLPGRTAVISNTAVNSDVVFFAIAAPLSLKFSMSTCSKLNSHRLIFNYSCLILLQLSVITLCVLISDDRSIDKEK